MAKSFPFKNLVFKGGGVKGIAYLGAIEVLDERKILREIERVAGASAGAITAMALSMSGSYEDVKRIVDSLDFSKIVGNGDAVDRPSLPRLVEEELERIFGNIEDLWRLLRHFGLHSSAYFYEWLQQTIAAQCGGNELATFADFREHGFRDLHVVAANVSRQTTAFFSADGTPDVAVADAVRMSMSLPLFFEAQRFDGHKLGAGDYFVDGGTQDNFPITIFDRFELAARAADFVDGVNWETLGFFLYTPASCKGAAKPITGLVPFIESLLETVLATQDFAFLHNAIDPARTVQVSDCCVPTTDFNIKPGDETYEKLVKSGRDATSAFLDSYEPPAQIASG